MSALTPALTNLLSIINTQTVKLGYSFQNPASPIIRALVLQGLIEGNAEQTNPVDQKQHAFRPTAAAAAHLPVGQAANEVEAATAAPPKAGRGGVRGPRGPNSPPVVHYTGSRVAVLPVATKGGTREGGIAFGKLGAPDHTGFDSLFIEATDRVPNPAKQYSSTLSKANKTMAPAQFKISAIGAGEDHEHPEKTGARVFRVK